MKKLITFLIASLFTLASYGQSGVAHYTGIKLGDGAGATTAYNLVSTADYTIQKVGSTYYARPGIGSGLTAYSNADNTIILQATINALPNGGIIHIKAGLYDNMDSVGITHDNITIEGDGPYLTILKLKNGFDTNRPGVNGSRLTGLIALRGGHHTTIKNLQLDGNAVNQTKIDDNNAGNGYYGFVNGITGSLYGQTPDYFTLDNCYIHDFPNVGVDINYSDGSVIKNSSFKDNGSNGISVESGAINTLVDNVMVEGGGDVGITLFGGSNNICQNFLVKNVSGTHGTTGSKWGVAFEGGDWIDGQATKNKYLHGKITGSGMLKGMVLGTTPITAHPLQCLVEDVEISTIGGEDGLQVSYDSASIINNVRIYNITGSAMVLYHPIATKFSNITISSPLSSYGIFSEAGSKNLIFDNINISNINGEYANGIKLFRDTASIMRNCFISNTSDNSITLQGCKSMIWDNLSADMVVSLEASSGYNSVGNIFKNSYFNKPTEWDNVVNISANCNNNIFQNNVLTSLTAGYGFSDASTGTIMINNYGIGNGKYKETGLWQTTATATVAGATTGILPPGNQNVTVTSANAAYIIALPAASAATIGTIITGSVGANGFHLRTQSAQEASVYLNGVTGAGKSITFAASTSFRATCIDATHWIIQSFTAAGVESAPTSA